MHVVMGAGGARVLEFKLKVIPNADLGDALKRGASFVDHRELEIAVSMSSQFRARNTQDRFTTPRHNRPPMSSSTRR